MKQLVCFIVNPASGIGRKHYIKAYIDQYLNKRKYTYQLYYTKAPQHATLLAQGAVQDGAAIIVAVGGDGSVNEVVAGLLGSNAKLAILPLGSGNAFATHLGISRKLPAAFAVINAANTLHADVGYVNNRSFVATSGLGFAAQIAYDIKGKAVRGVFAVPLFVAARRLYLP